MRKILYKFKEKVDLPYNLTWSYLKGSDPIRIKAPQVERVNFKTYKGVVIGNEENKVQVSETSSNSRIKTRIMAAITNFWNHCKL